MSESTSQPVSGGQILVDALVCNGVDTVYCVPGESYLPVLDALYDAPGVRTITARHEGAASNMADAYGKLTGRPGICFVTRGPGATHASNGVHTASEDSTPMILFIGQVERGFIGRGAFQEIDFRQMFGGIAKWVAEVDSIERIPEMVARAFSTALSGRPGPVVVVLPQDILFDSIAAAPPNAALAAMPAVPAAPGARALGDLRALLEGAARPLAIVGGTGWDADARAALKRFIHANSLPLAVSFRRQSLFDNRDVHYIGSLGLGLSPRLAQRAREADLLIVIGSRLSETSSVGYTLFESPRPQQTMVHVYPDAAELGRVYQARLQVHSSVRAFVLALDTVTPVASAVRQRWQGWMEAARADYVAYSTPQPASPEMAGVDLAQVVGYLSEVLPDDAVIANGAGNYTVWVHRFYRYRSAGTQLAPVNGAMGYGLPAAIAAKISNPERDVVCFAGDGCFMMYPQELATAMQLGAPLVLIVVNNAMLGTIRMHQERKYPGRISATQLVNPDFVSLAHAFGAHAERVERTEDFPAAFERARLAGVAALIELRTDPLQLTPSSRLRA
ncbi:MAG: thiamine pyrophosphate-binding protein [Burkholderiaceae bacterium]|jgi:acetolactate synthase-1/2/3 large subunit|nr:thiamine pyrophosphate-binding protein [Burkholderiaceae bacterium]